MPSFETSTTSTAPSSAARGSGSRVGRRPGPAGRVEAVQLEDAAGPVEHLGPPRHVLALDLVHLAPAWQERGRGKVFGRGGVLQAVLVDHGADELERRDVAAPDEDLAQPPVARPLLT